MTEGAVSVARTANTILPNGSSVKTKRADTLAVG